MRAARAARVRMLRVHAVLIAISPVITHKF